MSKMNLALKHLANKLHYEFNNPDLLVRALTHRSASAAHNERLEFLGDSVLGFVISAELYIRHQSAKEGVLSRMRASLVNGGVLATLALDLSVNEFLSLGVGERKSGGELRESILADALEAIIGAIYLDGGMAAASRCVLHWYGERFDDFSGLVPQKDAKSALQEWVQAQQLPLPTYDVTMTGQAHALTFKVVCTVTGLSYCTEGESTSRKKAEQLAAERYLEEINDNNTK